MRPLLILCACFVLTIAASAQQPNPPNSINIALDDLSSRLGVDLTLDDLDSWDWSQETFSDSSLGCPLPGQLYTQVLTEGYIFLLTYEGVTYDYRAPVGLNAATLCSGGALTAAPSTMLNVQEFVTVISPFNAATLSEIEVIEGDFGSLMAWSPTNLTLAVPMPTGNENGVLIYDTNDLSAEPRPVPLEQPVTALAYTPSGLPVISLVTGGAAGQVAIFPVEPKGFDILLMQTDDEEAINDVAISLDGTVIAAASDSAIRLWNASTGELITAIRTGGVATSIALSADGLKLAYGTADGTIYLHNFNNLEAEAELLQGHTDSILDLEFSPDSMLLASGSMDKTARLWNSADESQIAVLATGTDDGVMAVAFDRSGSLLGTAGGNRDSSNTNNDIRIWEVGGLLGGATPQPTATLFGHTAPVTDLVFSPFGSLLASIGEDDTIRLWSARD